MCGIFGYVTLKPRYNLAAMLGQGLIVDSLRGMCGTGIYGYSTKDKESLELKRALPGADFINTHQFDNYKENAHRLNVVIGHNRASTIGAAKDQNCHPFVYDHIGLVHNGTLRDYHNLNKSFTHPVDSAHAAYSMAKNGTIHTLERVKGAFVFCWHDTKENTFNIARNGMRDIWFITDKDGDNLYFASEYQMLDWVLDRNSIETHGKYRNPAEFTLLTWDVTKPLKSPKAVAFEEYKEPVHVYPSWKNNHSSYGHTWEHRDRQELKKLNLDYMERVEMLDPTWEPYHNGPYNTDGCITSIMEVEQEDKSKITCHFKLHGIKSKDWEETWSKVKFTGSMCNTFVKDDKGEQAITVIVRNPRELKEEDTTTEETSALDNLFRGPYGQWIGRDAFVRLTAAGCCYCSEPIKLTDEKSIKWMKVGSSVEPLCKNCTTDETILEEIKLYMTDYGTDRWSDYMD